MVTLDRYPDDFRSQVVFTLKAAAATNPWNDWMLARLVAAHYIIGCLFVIGMKIPP